MKLTRTRKRLLGVAVVAALLGGGSAAFAATDAPAGSVFSDTSVQIFDNPIPLQHIDAITNVTASYEGFAPGTPPGTPLGTAFTLIPVSSGQQVVKFSETGVVTPTWSIVSQTNIPAGVTLGINPTTGLLTVVVPPGPVPAANSQNIAVTVKVTDGTAVGFETLTAVPVVVGGNIVDLNVTGASDTVTLAGTNDNTTGRVDFAPAPAGVTFTGTNLPAGTGGNPGVTLTGNVLSATSTIPGIYNDIAVTATDVAGATATDTFDIYVKGAVAGSSIPRLSGGRATEGINPSRENVSFIQNNAASCDHFTIVGPGAINGHQGWVPGNLGLNVAVYGGLLQHHGYTVYYQPVSGPLDCSTHSTTPWPGAHWGYVFFVTA